ncbi:MAG: hypothetical protein AAF333_15370 [Planctomycetota bacterium]
MGFMRAVWRRRLEAVMVVGLATVGASGQAVEFVVNPAEDTGALPHFWTATGFTPPGLMEDERMKVQLAHLGGVPLAGVEWARVHDLLTLVSVEGADTDRPAYDWSRLDRALDLMLDAGMRPFFEVMGRPKGFAFTDARDPEQLAAWRRLVRDLARHLIDRYGREEVRSWVFEVWNEPDVHPWFNHPWAEDDPVGLIRYYDATSAGLMDADPALRFGGPGTAEQLSVMFTELMKHLDTGTNHLTGQSPPRCDFISVHVKGGPASPLPADPSMDVILDGQNELFEYLVEHHPRLAELPLINNECDPLVGWSHDHHWRGTSYYPTFVARLVHRQLDEMVRGDSDFVLMSNDHGFLGGWGLRSVMVPFGGGEDAPHPGVSMVKKPVLEGMTLMSLLGDRTVAVAGPGPGSPVRCLASRTAAGDLALMITHHDDDSSATGNASVSLNIAGGTEVWPRMSVLRIDAGHTHPQAVWEQAGRPDAPTPEQLHAMREAAELDVAVSDTSNAPITFEVPMHGVVLVVLTSETPQAPAAPSHVQARVSPGLHGDEVLVQWDNTADPRRLRGELVEAVMPDGTRRALNTAPVISATLIRPLPPGATAVRVRSVDVWDRVGESAYAPISSSPR